MSGRRDDTDFVGRERELAELGAALARALDGRGNLVLVSGEPGIGKSRLLEETSIVAERNGARIVTGQCWEAGGAPAFWPWIQVLRQMRDDVPASVRRELTGEGSGAGGAESISPDGVRFCLFDSVSLALERAARATPLVILLDDLHWSDVSSLQLLRFFAEALPRARILVVGSYREHEVRSGPGTDLFANLVRASHRIPLRGLAPEAVGEYIEVVSGFAVADNIVKAVHRTTAGNPLFVREVVRQLVAEGRLAEGETPSESRLGIPDEVRALIRRRVQALSPGTQEALRSAAVVGRDVELSVLQRVCALEPGALVEALGEAVTAGLVAPDETAPARYRFTHGLLRETLYDDLPGTERAELHARIGAVLAELHGADVEPHLPELAHHYFEAIPMGHADVALDYARRAGEAAVAHFAYEEAVLHFGRALHALGLHDRADERARCELLLALGEAQWRSASKDLARSTFEDAARLARKLGDGTLFARAALGYAGAEVQGFSTYTDDKIIGLLEEALERLGPADSLLRVRLLARLAMDMYWMGIDRRVGLIEEAVDMARRLDDPRAQLVALYGREWATLGPDTLKERLASADEILSLARTIGDREMTYLGHQFRATTLMELDSMTAVDAEIESCTRVAKELGAPLYLWQTAVFHAMRALVGGALVEAERVAEESLRIGRHAPVSDVVVTSYGAQLFYVRWLQGRLDEMEPAMRTYAESYPWIPAWGAGLAFVYGELGRTADAAAQLARLTDDDFAALPRDAGWLTAMWALSICACSLDDRARAGMLYEMLLPYADRTVSSGYVLSFGSAETALGMLAATLKRRQAADRHFEAAVARNTKMGNKPILALTLLERARMLRDSGRDPGDAAGALAQARALIDACGLDGLRPRADALGAPASEPAGAAAVAPVEAGDTFRLEGQYWTISHGGRLFRLKDVRGLHYIRHLLANPGVDLHATDVASAGGAALDTAAPVGEEVRAGRMRVSRLDEHDQVLDEEAKAAYRRRLAELREDLEEARSWGDPERAARVESEIEALTREITRAVGLSGRTRSMPTPGERARVAVTKAIRAAVERIEESAPDLAAHLRTAVRTGRVCRYDPGPDGPRWRL